MPSQPFEHQPKYCDAGYGFAGFGQLLISGLVPGSGQSAETEKQGLQSARLALTSSRSTPTSPPRRPTSLDQQIAAKYHDFEFGLIGGAVRDLRRIARW
jgi:hypothetical protein